MNKSLSQIQLELAPCPTHRFGDPRFVYHLFLPLGDGDRLDLGAIRRGEGPPAVLRFRPGNDVAYGRIRLEPDGWLSFSFAGDRTNHPVGFRTPPDRFVVGQVTSIVERDGEKWPFQVVAIREAAHQPEQDSFADMESRANSSKSG